METIRDTGYRDELARLTPGLRRFARALVRNHKTDVADDLVQATLTRALGGDQKRRAVRLQLWLVSMLVGLHRDQIGDLSVEQKLGFAGGDPLGAGGNMAARTARRDPSPLSGIPVEYREVLLLVVLEGLSYAQVAECLGLSVATVSTRVARARDYLARQQAGGPLERAVGGTASRAGRAHPTHLRVVK